MNLLIVGVENKGGGDRVQKTRWVGLGWVGQVKKSLQTNKCKIKRYPPLQMWQSLKELKKIINQKKVFLVLLDEHVEVEAVLSHGNSLLELKRPWKKF